MSIGPTITRQVAFAAPQGSEVNVSRVASILGGSASIRSRKSSRGLAEIAEIAGIPKSSMEWASDEHRDRRREIAEIAGIAKVEQHPGVGRRACPALLQGSAGIAGSAEIDKAQQNVHRRPSRFNMREQRELRKSPSQVPPFDFARSGRYARSLDLPSKD
jgi:hypothetical protein